MVINDILLFFLIRWETCDREMASINVRDVNREKKWIKMMSDDKRWEQFFANKRKLRNQCQKGDLFVSS